MKNNILDFIFLEPFLVWLLDEIQKDHLGEKYHLRWKVPRSRDRDRTYDDGISCFLFAKKWWKRGKFSSRL